MKIVTSRSSLVAVLGSLLLTSSGCSFVFVQPPSNTGRVAGPRGECTSSKLAPVLDTLFTAAQVVRTAYAASASDSVYDDPAQPLSRGADVGLGVGFATLFLSSAIYGYVGTSACSKRGSDPGEVEDDDLSPERWTTSPTVRPKPAASAAEQPVEPAAPPSPPAEAPVPSVEPTESDAPADAPASPPPPAPPGVTES